MTQLAPLLGCFRRSSSIPCQGEDRSVRRSSNAFVTPGCAKAKAIITKNSKMGVSSNASKPSKLKQHSIPWTDRLLPAGASQTPCIPKKRIAHGTKEITEQKKPIKSRGAGAGTHYRTFSSSSGAATRASGEAGGHGVASPCGSAPASDHHCVKLVLYKILGQR